MDYNSLESLKEYGFEGFESIGSMMHNSCGNVPQEQGIYFVLNPDMNKEFIKESTGGWFKKKNPSLPQHKLESNWVEDTLVLYIGKAGGPDSSATLNSRLKQYMQFGQGKAVGHWGGRLIWHLKNSHELILCWKKLPADNPRDVEKNLIQDFAQTYGMRPFANLVG
jgi:hypothetical protein